MQMKIKLIILTIILLILTGIVLNLFVFTKPSYQKINLPFGNNDGKYIGIIQIGSMSFDYDYSVVDKYFKTREFETIEFGGTEKYLIIPRNKKVEVYSLEMDLDGAMKETYIKSMTEPFYITCNVSDIIANSLFRVMIGGKQHSYSPYISLKDGTLVVEDFVLHIK